MPVGRLTKPEPHIRSIWAKKLLAVLRPDVDCRQRRGSMAGVPIMKHAALWSFGTLAAP